MKHVSQQTLTPSSIQQSLTQLGVQHYDRIAILMGDCDQTGDLVYGLSRGEITFRIINTKMEMSSQEKDVHAFKPTVVFARSISQLVGFREDIFDLVRKVVVINDEIDNVASNEVLFRALYQPPISFGCFLSWSAFVGAGL